MPVRSHSQRVYIEAGGKVVRRFHDRRWRRDNTKPSALPDPVDMPMAVHEYCSAGQELQTTNKPIAVDQGRSNALGKGLCRARVLDEMMVEGNHPARVRVLRAGDLDPAGLFRRDQSKRVGE
jgi:hypothetical protein